jgi:protein-disulfide isomerase
MSSKTPGLDLAMRVNATDHALGPDHAPVTVVEYGDFQCPTCKVAAPAVKVLIEKHVERVRFVFRHFPLEAAHPHALSAAETAECAGAQSRFWEMHDLLFANQSHLEGRHQRAYAERLGLDMTRYTVEMDDHVYLQRVREHLESGRASHVRGTPGFFVNGIIQDVSFGMQGLFDAVESALNRE